MDKVVSQITAIIKTFERPEKVIGLYRSLRAFYPDLRVIIVDDSAVPIEYEWGENTEYIFTTYDIGLSQGRNLAVANVTTAYTLLLDDDFIFSKETKIENFLCILEKTDFQIVAGQVFDFGKKRLVFKGIMEVEDNVLFLNNYRKGRNVDGYICYDFVLNFFLARTQTLRDHPWDNDLKIREHEEYFWRLKNKKVLITSTPTVSISHFPTSDIVINGDMYFEKRVERMKFYHALACRKIGVKDFCSIGARYYGFGVLHFLIYLRMVSERKRESAFFWNLIYKVFLWNKPYIS